MSILSLVIALVGFVVVAPLLGCLLAGIDRIVTARMQGRVGPPLLQPYYDVRKLLSKERRTLNSYQDFYLICAFIMTLFAGVLFFAGGNLLFVVFLTSLATLFFVIAAYSSRSPYAEAGAGREIIQVLAYEPMLILMAVFYYFATNSFDTGAVFGLDVPLIALLPLIFIGLVFILTIKLRKSPFDLSYSHHAHQELVKGITTEMSGRSLAIVEVLHWYETVLFMGYVGLFFIWAGPVSLVVAVLAALIIYFLEVVIDNSFARVKWQSMLGWSWVVTLACTVVSLVIIVAVNSSASLGV